VSTVLRDFAIDQRAERIDDLKALTERIRERMLARDWATAADLDLERRSRMSALFERRPTSEELPSFVEGLRELVRMNDELLGLMAHQRRTLDRQADTLSAARRMGAAYLGGQRKR